MCHECHNMPHMHNHPHCGPGIHHEHDIFCADPVCMHPCWDTCKCMDEILKLKAGENSIDSNLKQLDGRIDKVEKDVSDMNDSLTAQMGALAEKEQHDVDCLNKKIEAETERAIAREDEIAGGIAAEEARAKAKEAELATNIAEERARAIGEEARIDDKLNDEIAERKTKAIAHAEYISNDGVIRFTNASGEIVDDINADPFIKDGMVDSVIWDPGTKELVITWNVDADKSVNPTRIPGSSIFNPDDYYTRQYIDGKVMDINTNIQLLNTGLSTTNNELTALNTRVNNMQANTIDGAKVIDFGETETIATVNGVAITAGIPEFPKVVQKVYVTNDGRLMVHYSDNPEQAEPFDLPAGYINRVSQAEIYIDQLQTLTKQQQQTINDMQQTINNLTNRIAALENDSLWYLDSSTNRVTTKNNKAAAAYGFYDTDPNMI